MDKKHIHMSNPHSQRWTTDDLTEKKKNLTTVTSLLRNSNSYITTNILQNMKKIIQTLEKYRI